MAPTSSNRSIYLPDEFWAWAEAEAKLQGLSVNGLVKLAMRRLQADLHPLPAALPKLDTADRAKPDLAKIAKPAATAGLQLGPRASAPGSRLKAR